jgi:hypothetical protein
MSNLPKDMDVFTESLKLEFEISQLILKDNGCYTHFEKTAYKLNIVTYNPKHNTYFLLCSIPIRDSISSMQEEYYYTLKDAFDYLDKNIKSDESSSYTVTWKDHSVKDIQTSFFWAKNILKRTRIRLLFILFKLILVLETFVYKKI